MAWAKGSSIESAAPLRTLQVMTRIRFGFTVQKHIFKGRCLHGDTIEVVEGSFDECVFCVLLSNSASSVSSLQLPTERGCRMVMTLKRQSAKVPSSKTRCRVGSSKMSGSSRKANEDTIGEKSETGSWASREHWASDGFHGTRSFVTERAALGEECIPKRLVYVESKDRHGKCTLHYCSSSSSFEEWVKEVERDPWIERFSQDPKEILQVEAVKTGQ